MTISVHPVVSAADRRRFIDLPFRLYAEDPHWVPPLKSEVRELMDPARNPWFEHGDAEFFLAERAGKTVGRISAHIDHLALVAPADKGFGPGTGHWGFFEAEDAETAAALIEAAEHWLARMGMTRVVAPVSLSMWDEPGLLTFGFDQSPTVMMGHHSPRYAAWVEAGGYAPVKRLDTYELDISRPFPPLIQRIVAAGERNPRIRIRPVDKSRFDAEAAIVLGILNDGWSDNWGAVPLTDAEIAYAGKKLKPLVFEDLVSVAEVDGEPVAFMITFPDLNEVLKGLNGSLLPLGWLKLLLWLRRPKARRMRVPLMGVVKRLQASRLASQLAFMMIETSRIASTTRYGATRGEIGWILDDNQGMVAIADAIEAHVNRSYTLYARESLNPPEGSSGPGALR